MSTTFVRIPVPQPLWDAVRATGQAYVLALVADERVRALYVADPTEVFETLCGRDQVLIDAAQRVRTAREAMQAAITALAQAEVAHVMGPKS